MPDRSHIVILLRRWTSGHLLGDRQLAELTRDGYIHGINGEYRLTQQGIDLLNRKDH